MGRGLLLIRKLIISLSLVLINAMLTILVQKSYMDCVGSKSDKNTQEKCFINYNVT